jgi:iron complex outermembrane receptor protein
MTRNKVTWGISTAAMIAMMGFPAALNAQTSADQKDAEIVVTGSRITTAGFQAPTPTTVISNAELRQGGRTDLQSALADLPEVRQTTSAITTNTTTNSGQSPADIRGLGSSRTLVLVNGHRFVSSDDLQTIPFGLTKSVDIVTGGASAAYGSDAVAGVINIVLDDKFKGLTLNAQSGISSRGDGEKQAYSLSFGTMITDRWHVMIGADYLNDHGIIPAINRPRIGATAFVVGTDGVLRPTQDIHQADRSSGGLIRSGALAGQTFNDDGTLRPFQFGRIVGTTQVGGEGYNADQVRSLSSPLERGTVFARTSYEVTDSLKIWAEGNYAKTSNERPFFPDLAASATAYTYFTANPYLPAAARTALTAAGQTSFTMTRVLSDISLDRYRFERTVKEGTIGFDGKIGSHWSYSGYYTHGEQTQNLQLFNLIKNAEFRNAIDVVTGPAGTPICRIALTVPGTACRPLNLFGQGHADPAAVAYATGNWQDIAKNWLDDAGLTLNGEPFRLWNRPVSIAAGISYRKQAFSTSYDATSLAGGFSTINGVNIAKVGNNVKEAFAEINVPVLADLPFVQELTFNGAARVSKYSTFSKNIWSWKAGAIWKIDDNIKLRITRSRDIRAPNLTDLYSAPGTLFSVVNDLSKPAGSQSVTAILRSGGNPNLAPEKGDTLTAGVVLTPKAIRGLSLSVDYYDIKIANVITTLSAQQIINACYNQGLAAACGQLRRDASGTLTDIFATAVNIAKFHTNGVDAELAYRTRVDKIGLPGQITFRLLTNYVHELISDNGVLRVDGAGFAGSQAAYLTPHWRANGSINYESKSVGVDVRGRFISASQFAPYQIFGVANASLVDDKIPSFFYVDLTLRGYIPFGGDMGHRLTVFTSVSNLFDKQPPIGAVSSPYYDVVGRYITVGATFKF